MSSKLKIDHTVLDDLCSRFLLNIPAQEKEDMVRLCFQIELAHWFYLDFYRPDNSSLPDCRMYEFAKVIFREYPFLLKPQDVNVEEILERWKVYKRSVPTYGAVLLDSTLDYVLLVQGYWIKASWGFPKGKINKAELPEACAVREVMEETGFDISEMIDKTQYAEHHLNEQLSRLYFIPNVPMDILFKAKTRGEIKDYKWFHVNDLPAHRKDTTPKQALNLAANCFFMVIPFVKQLRRWIASKRQSSLVGGETGVAISTDAHKSIQNTKPGERSRKHTPKQSGGKFQNSQNSATSIDQGLAMQQQTFSQANTSELEAILTNLQKPQPKTPEHGARQRRRGSGRGNNSGNLQNNTNKLLYNVESKGRGRTDLDYMPDAWKNFHFDRNAIEKAIFAFHNNSV